MRRKEKIIGAIIIVVIAAVCITVGYFNSSSKKISQKDVEAMFIDDGKGSLKSTDTFSDNSSTSNKKSISKDGSNKNTGGVINVEIKGAVKNPDVYKMDSGSIVNDLIQKSGGANNDADMSQDVESAYDEVEKEGLEESENMAEEIENKLLQSGVADQVEVTAYSKYVMLNVSGGILFESGQAELTTEARALLDKVGDALVDYDDNIITIEGHTDNVPINTARYPNNMMLSLYRAYSVFDFFVSEKGFSEKSMSSSGRGDAVPIATNDTPEGRAQNRRVEIKVYNSINS